MHHSLNIGERSLTTHALVLAAGAATRFGGGKLLAPWRGRPLIAGALDAAWAAPVAEVTLVTGCDAAAVEAAARTLAAGRGLAVVEAPAWRTGLAASLRAGLAVLPSTCERVFVFLADMPRTPHDVAARLSLALGDADAATPVYVGVRGHPVLIARSLFARLAELDGDRGAGGLLAQSGVRVVEVRVDDDGVGFDVDTRAALLATG